MTASLAEASPRRKARVAGFLYLITFIAGGWSFSVRSGMIVRGDAAATATRILAAEHVYRLALVADLVAGVCYIAVAVILYEVLKPVSRTMSLLAAFFGAAGCIAGAATSIGRLIPLVVLHGAPYLASFSEAQLQSFAMISLSVDGLGFAIGFIFFGCYCTLVGYLVFRSTFIPRIIGILFAIAGLGWLVSSFVSLLAPEIAPGITSYITMTSGLGEASLCLWLLLVGLNASKWQERAAIRQS